MVAVCLVAAVASVATSQSSSVIRADPYSGAFLLTAENPVAEVFVVMSANDVTRESGRPVITFGSRFFTLDTDLPSNVVLTRDGQPVGTFGQVAVNAEAHPSFGQRTTFRFRYVAGSSPALVRWSLEAKARFETDDAPDGATVDLNVSTTGPVEPVSVLASHHAEGGGWLHSNTKIDTATAIDPGAELWFGVEEGGDRVLIERGGGLMAVEVGGGAQVTIPPGCHEGPCSITHESISAPIAAWVLLAVGDDGVEVRSVDRSQSSGERSRAILERTISLAAGQSTSHVLTARVAGVDPELVAALPPIVGAGPSAEVRLPDGIHIDFSINGEPMVCTGQTCEISTPVTITNRGTQDQTFLGKFIVVVAYEQAIPVDVMLQP